MSSPIDSQGRELITRFSPPPNEPAYRVIAASQDKRRDIEYGDNDDIPQSNQWPDNDENQ